jgi:hypothetical protein
LDPVRHWHTIIEVLEQRNLKSAPVDNTHVYRLCGLEAGLQDDGVGNSFLIVVAIATNSKLIQAWSAGAVRKGGGQVFDIGPPGVHDT